MKSLKLLLKSLLLLLLISLLTLLFLLENLNLINPYIKTPLKDFNVSFELSGGLFSGVKVKEFNYSSDIKADSIYLKINYIKLLDSIAEIELLEIKDLNIDEKFIKSIQNQKSEKEVKKEEELIIPYLKEIRLNRLNFSAKEISYDEYKLNNLNINLKNNSFYLATKEAFINFAINLNSNIINIENLNGNFRGEKYNLTSILKLPRDFLFSDKISDKNVTLQNIENIKLTIDGNFKKLNTKLNLNAKSLYSEIKLTPKEFNLNAGFDIEKSLLNLNINSLLTSTIANIDLKTKLSTNLNDINASTKYTLSTKIDNFKPLKKSYLYKFIQDENISLNNLNIALFAHGDLNNTKANLAVNAKEVYKEFNLSLHEFNSSINYNLLNSKLKVRDTFTNIETNLTNITLESANVDFDVNSLNYYYSAKIKVDDIKLPDLNLREFDNSTIEISGNQKSFNSKIDLHLFGVEVDSNDLNKIEFTLHSKDIYFAKIATTLPKEFENSFVKIYLNGNYDINLSELNSNIKLVDSNIYQKSLKSNEFKIYFKNENLRVDKLKLFADGVKLNLNAKKSSEDIDLKLSTNGLKLNIDGRIKPLNIKASSNIDIKALQNEANLLYPFEKLPLDGKINLTSQIDGNLTNPIIDLNIDSKKVTFEDKEIKDITLNVNATKEKIILKTLNFALDKFEKELNRDFNLTKEAIVEIDGENIRVSEVVINEVISLNLEKIAKKIEVALKSDKLIINKDGYGRVKFDSDINVTHKEKTKVIGKIILDELEITYPVPKTITPPSDEDIIIVKEEEKKEDGLKNLYLDVSIKNRDKILYQNDDGQIWFNIDLKIAKEFDSELSIIGYIDLIEGEYNFEGKKFFIESSQIRFSGVKYLNPLLDLKLKYIENKVEITIAISGNLKNPKLEFSSNPFMPKKDIISYLLFGKSSDELLKDNGKKANYSQKALIFLSNSISKDIAKGLGVKLDKIDISQDEESEAINVEIGKRVTDDITINYKNSANKNSIIIEYDISKRLGVESEISSEGNSIDLFYKKEY